MTALPPIAGSLDDAGRRWPLDTPPETPIRDPDDVTLAAFMADAGRILGASLDSAATLRQIADLIVPGVADWCAIDLFEADGTLASVAVAHRDPDRVALVEELRRRYPADPDAPVGAHAVARTGQAMIIPEIDEAMIRASARDAEHLALIQELELRSWMCAPMMAAGGKPLGTIAFAGAETGRVFGPRHLRFAVDLAARAGAAVENARAFQAADRFRQILDAVAEAIFVLDPGSDVIQGINHGASELLGRTASDLVGRRLSDLVEDSVTEGVDRVIRAVREGRSEARTVSLRFRREDAPAIPAEVLLQRVELPGEAPTIVAIARDVRERLEVQGRLKRLAEAEHARAAELNAVIRAMGDGVIVCAADGRTILANPAGRAMFPSITEISYAGILAALRDPEGVAPPLGTHAGPVVFRTRAEPERWIEVATYPVDRANDGETRGETILVLRDVTEQRQREAVRETFIGVLSHELRTPVTTIFGGARVLSREDSGLDDVTRREILNDVADEAERLKRLVEDVVALSRFGETEADLGREPVLLQRVVPAVVASEEERWPGVDFTVQIPPGLPTVVADPTYLEQVIRNLLANAAKYGGQGATVEVVVESDTDAEEVSVCVRDDGPGIEPDEAERLFDLFYRSPTTATVTAGAGIGLFVCSRLVRAMGGRVWARALPAGGAEFAFALRVMHED